MPYTILIAAGTDAFESLADRLEHIDGVMDRLIDEDILPLLGTHFDRAGIKTHSSHLRNAITVRGAAGNLITKGPETFSVGIDYQQIPYAKYVLEGRGPVIPKTARALRFYDEEGQPVFRTHAGPAPPHPVYYMTADDLKRVEKHAQEILTEGK